MFFFESFYYFYSLKTKLFYNEMKHIRLIFSAILLSLVVPCGYAQTRQDSLAIAHAQWHTDTLQHGAVCMYTNIHVFDSPQQISIIKYDPKKYKTQIVQAPLMVPASSSRSYVPVAAVTSILSVTPTSWLFPILAYPPSNALTPVNLIYPCPTSTTIE